MLLPLAPPGVQAQENPPPQAESLIEAAATTTAEEVRTAAATISKSITPPFPVFINVQIDRPVLVVGESANVTVRVASNTGEATPPLQVTLDLPNGLAANSSPKNKVRWDVPALAAGQEWQQAIAVVVDKPKQAMKQGVVRLLATAQSAKHAPYRGSVLVGIAPDAPTTESVLDTEGTVVRNATGDVTLLVAPGAAALGTHFTYTERHHWQQPGQSGAQGDQEAGSSNPDANAALRSANLAAPPQPVSSANIDAYVIWQFDALQGGQAVEQFTSGVQVAVSAAGLVAQGIDPATLNLWTRPDATGRWEVVESRYEATTATFSAFLPHFSEFSLAQGLSEHNEMLPSIRAGSVDRFNGGANFSYPIETPKGLGGLSPNLSLNYSSVTVDELFRKNGADAYKAQASNIGLGWSLGGISYIARAGGSMDKDVLYKEREYVLALNGQHVRIKYEDNVWQTDPALFAKIERAVNPNTGGRDYEQWVVTTTDGVKYTFGDATVNETTFVSTAATATYAQKQSGKDNNGNTIYARMAKKWYLVTVQDLSGNRINYSYRVEAGHEIGCLPPNRPDLEWYTRDIDPSEITWSENGAVGPHLRVTFTYGVFDRLDYQVEKWGGNDCQQTDFGRTNTLQVIRVQAQNTAGGWDTLRSYDLNHPQPASNPTPTAYNVATAPSDYSQGVTAGTSCTSDSNYCKRLLLKTLEAKGKNDTLISRYTFSYEGVKPSAIFLKSADNNLGGKITYTYLGHQPTCSEGTCGDFDVRWRQAVVRTDVTDGLGHTAITTYCYGSAKSPDAPTLGTENSYCDEAALAYRCPDPNSDQQVWGSMSGSGEFLGYCRADATYYALTTNPTVLPAVVKWERMDTWQGPRDNPDPRRGRVWKTEIRSAPDSPTILALTENQWNAYRSAFRAAPASDPNCPALANWCTTPTNRSTHKEGQADVYHINWLRLDGTSTWEAGVGQWTRYFYSPTLQLALEGNQQSPIQFGNVTAVEEWSHPATSITIGDWQQAVATYMTTPEIKKLRTTQTEYFPNRSKQLGSQPARVQIFDAANNCVSEQRLIYSDWAVVNHNMDGQYKLPPQTPLVARTEKALFGCYAADSIANSNTQWDITRHDYDLYGNPTLLHRLGDTSAGDDTLYTEYDSFYRLFPIRQYLGQDNSFAETASYYGVNGPAASDWRANWGAMAEHCGVNGLCTRQAYDDLGRPAFRWEKVGAGAAWSDGSTQSADQQTALVRWEYRDPLHNPGWPTTVVNEWRAPRCEGNFVRKHYNGLGQLVAEQKPAQDWGLPFDGCPKATNLRESEILYGYDSLGQQIYAATPYFTTADWVQRIANTTWSTVWNNIAKSTTTYDNLGRPSQVLAANGQQMHYSYVGRATSTVDDGDINNPNDNKVVKWQEVDELGYPRSVRTYAWNPAIANWEQKAQVTLVHDVLGNLTCVFQPFATSTMESNPNCNTNPINHPGVTAIQYDRGGRKTLLNDPDLGSWYYQYDRQGHLVYQAFGGNKITCLYYDAVGRLKGKIFQGNTTCLSNPTSYNLNFSYDENQSVANRSRGQLTSVFYADGSYGKTVHYDSQGLLSKEVVTNQGAGKIYTTTYGYDAYQRLTTVTYPDEEQLTTTYNGLGLPKNLQSSKHGWLVDGTVEGGASYDEAGRLTAMRFPAGGNLQRRYTYAPWGEQSPNGGLLTGIQVGTATAPASLLNLAYSYDHFGNVVTLNDGTYTHSFSYDAQNRLLSAYGRSYAYDEAGRLTHYEGKTLIPHDLKPHALKEVNSDTSYKPSGNMYIREVASGSKQYLNWNIENRLTSITANSNVLESYLYDADGIRVKKQTGGQATYYINQYYEVQGPDVPSSQLTSAMVEQGASTPVEQLPTPALVALTPRLFLAQVSHAAQVGNAESQPVAEGAVTYARANTGAACTPGTADDCMAWHVSQPTTATTLLPPLAAVDVVLPLPVITATQTLTDEQPVLWSRPTTLLPTDQWAVAAGEISGTAPVAAAAFVPINNADFQNLNTTGTAATDWTAYRPDTTAFPNASAWANSSNIAAGYDNPADSGAHRGQSLSNLAYGWLESSSITGLTAGQTYSFTVDMRGALDETNNSQGRWLVRAVFVDLAGNPLPTVAPVVVAQGNGSAINPDQWRRLGGMVAIPSGATRVRLHLVNELNAGWLAFDNVAFRLNGSGPNLAPNSTFESSGSWLEKSSMAHEGTGFYRTQRLTPYGIPFTSTAYVISNQVGGWLESNEMAVQANNAYVLAVDVRGKVDTDEGQGKITLEVTWYNSSGLALLLVPYSWQTAALSATTWQTLATPGLYAPPDASKARIRLYSQLGSGWVTFDNVQFGDLFANNQNLAPNPGFESGSGGWTGKRIMATASKSAYPATGFARDQAGIASGKDGSYGYSIHNLAQGYVQSAAVAVTDGVKYKLKFWTRGQFDSDDAQGDWRVRGQFSDASGASLGVQEICTSAAVEPTWREITCYFYPPGNAASVKLQLWLVQQSGWVAFDDFRLTSKAAGNGSYYYFGGQRIAMLNEEGLKYIHTDHLNSTTLLTDDTGNPLPGTGPTANATGHLRYYAYGNPVDPQSVIGLPTEYAFTGQRHDSVTGLIYMNARYYDPELGIFISPDTLIPDPTNVMDFNRYMFVRGNPLRYNDPTGHNIWDTFNATAEFLNGAITQWVYNNSTALGYPDHLNVYGPAEGESNATTWGRQAGNVVSVVQGTIETGAGVTAMALGITGGAATCTETLGAGCVAGAAVVAEGAVVAAHGGAVTLIAAANAGKLTNVMMAQAGDGSSGSSPVYRGGPSLTPRSIDVKIDKKTGLVQPGRGVSLYNDPARVQRFGGAYKIDSIPDGLQIIQRGTDPSHFELVPTEAMAFERYEELLSQVVMKLVE